MAVYNGALYAGGRFDSAGGLWTNRIAKWNGTQWAAVDSGIFISEGVNCLTLYNGSLYAGGNFYKAGSIAVRNVAVWNDTAWAALSNPLPACAGQVTSMVSYQGSLYAAYFTYVTSPSHTVDSLGIWDGRNWTTIAGAHSTFFNIGIDVLFVFDGKLIAGGGFDSIGGLAANNLAQWDGVNWSEFGGGIIGPNTAQVDALCSYNAYLYAGGDFNMAGSASINSIAEYTCATNGIRDIASASNVYAYPNPASDQIKFEVLLDQPSDYTLYITNIIGQKISETSLPQSSTTTNIDVRQWPAGLYIYRISSEKGFSSSGEFVVSH